MERSRGQGHRGQKGAEGATTDLGRDQWKLGIPLAADLRPSISLVRDDNQMLALLDLVFEHLGHRGMPPCPVVSSFREFSTRARFDEGPVQVVKDDWDGGDGFLV